MVGRLLVAAAPTVLLAPDTANADDVLATLPSLQQSPFSRLSAYAGQVVWSERVSSDGYVLRRWRAGGVDRLPVRPRMVPFDLDLGPDAGGRAVAVVQEGFADVPHSPNVTPDETTWVRDVSTPCLATRSVVDRHGQRRMTLRMPRNIHALARDGSTLYAITSAPAPCSVPSDGTLVRLSPPVFVAAR